MHGKRHLGAAVGSRDFITEYVSHKVEEWCKELMSLARIAKSQPHAAFVTFTHGMASKWTYVSRPIPEIDDLLQPLEEIIHQHFIPAITGHPPCSPCERQPLAYCPDWVAWAYPIHHQTHKPCLSHQNKYVTVSFVALTVLWDPNGSITEEPKRTKAPVRKAKREKQLADAHDVRHQLPSHQQRLNGLCN